MGAGGALFEDVGTRLQRSGGTRWSRTLNLSWFKVANSGTPGWFAALESSADAAGCLDDMGEADVSSGQL